MAPWFHVQQHRSPPPCTVFVRPPACLCQHGRRVARGVRRFASCAIHGTRSHASIEPGSRAPACSGACERSDGRDGAGGEAGHAMEASATHVADLPSGERLLLLFVSSYLPIIKFRFAYGTSTGCFFARSYTPRTDGRIARRMPGPGSVSVPRTLEERGCWCHRRVKAKPLWGAARP